MFSKKSLPNKLKNEEIVIMVKRDVLVILKRIGFFIFLAILPIIVYKILFSQIFTIDQDSIFYAMIILGAVIYFLSIWLFLLFSIVDYYLDMWIVTNRRIISIEQKGFFSRTIAEVKLFRIQDVKSNVEGLVSTIFNYGSVHIQSAGTNPNFHFEEVPDPDRIKDMIVNLVQKNKEIFKNEININ